MNQRKRGPLDLQRAVYRLIEQEDPGQEPRFFRLKERGVLERMTDDLWRSVASILKTDVDRALRLDITGALEPLAAFGLTGDGKRVHYVQRKMVDDILRDIGRYSEKLRLLLDGRDVDVESERDDFWNASPSLRAEEAARYVKARSYALAALHREVPLIGSGFSGTPPALAFRPLCHVLGWLSKGAREARTRVDLPRRRGPDATHFQMFISRLAVIYLERTGRRAALTRDPVGGSYSGAFLDLARTLVGLLPAHPTWGQPNTRAFAERVRDVLRPRKTAKTTTGKLRAKSI
jgi:hypothetical protein